MMGLRRTVGLVFGWYDNSDLSVSTPNGHRETHAMATEFQVHPAGIIQPGTAQLPGLSTLVIPRLTAKQYKSLDDTRANLCTTLDKEKCPLLQWKPPASATLIFVLRTQV